ncbi:MAG TPA: LPS export ABC transporter periplasmic protein LptC [Methylocella sp.]|jgi:lipopolysaccharide export system protein LptC
MKQSSGRPGVPASAASGAGSFAGMDRLEHAKLLRTHTAKTGSGRADGIQAESQAVRFDMTPALWGGGFKAARRHSARVRLFRRAAIAASLLAITLIPAVALFNPLRYLPGDISAGRATLDGTKITVNSPTISGVQKGGLPFEIKARSGTQDTTVPNVIELLGIESKIGGADASTTWVRAMRGIYDSLHSKMTLEGDVRIKSSTGYDLRLRTARIDFNTGGLVSEEPVNVILDGATIAAQQIDVSDNGHKVSFAGDVASKIDANASGPEAAAASTESGK